MRKAFLSIIISSLIFLPLANVLAYDTDYRYTGKPFDIDADLYNYGQRYYNPNAGQFTQPDPVANYLTNPEKMKKATGMDLQEYLLNPQNFNTYSYTINNPVRYTDPTGEWWKEFFTGKQNLSSLSSEIGEATMFVNPVMTTAIDHPYITGAIIGVAVPLAATGIGALIERGLVSLGLMTSATRVIQQTVQKHNNLPQLTILQQVSSAVTKLNSVSKEIGLSVNNILKQADKSQLIFKDMKYEGNINVFIKHPSELHKLIRVTLDPTKNRIISAGYDRINDVLNYIETGRFVKTE